MGLATWWGNLAPNQQQAVYLAAFFLALTWVLGGLLLYAIRDANRRGEAKKSPSPQEDEVSCCLVPGDEPAPSKSIFQCFLEISAKENKTVLYGSLKASSRPINRLRRALCFLVLQPAAAAAGPPRRAARGNRLQAGLRRRQAAAAAAAAAQEAADESERGGSSDGEVGHSFCQALLSLCMCVRQQPNKHDESVACVMDICATLRWPSNSCLCGCIQEADAEEEAGGDGGRRRAREARRDARQAERQMLDARMRKREVRHSQKDHNLARLSSTKSLRQYSCHLVASS